MITVVGNGRDKFTEYGYQKATEAVKSIIDSNPNEEIASGDSPMKGIDYLAKTLTPPERYMNRPPNYATCNVGFERFRERNLQLAESRIVYVIVSDNYPPEYKGKRFLYCYHCLKMNRNASNHCKSGACWTAMMAIEKGNKAIWIIIPNKEVKI